MKITVEELKAPISYISPDLYKALKYKEMTQEKMIRLLTDKVSTMQELIDAQEETIRKLERIIDALI